MNSKDMRYELEYEEFEGGILIARQCDGPNCIEDQIAIYDCERLQAMRAICPHDQLIDIGYLNPCRNSGCNFQTDEHRNCGQQFRIECERCGAVLYDSANYDYDDPQRDADYGALVAKYGTPRRE